jgi:hypothetical protein
MLKLIKKIFQAITQDQSYQILIAEEERLSRLSKQRIETHLKLLKLFKPKPTKKIQL